LAAPTQIESTSAIAEEDSGLRLSATGVNPSAPLQSPALFASQETQASSGNVSPNTSASPTPSPTPQPTPTPRSGPPCEAAGTPLYCVYTVQSGDTLGGIAARFGLKGNDQVTAAELLVYSNRPNLTSEDDLLQIGQKLRIPRNSGVIHEVVSSQTLTDVSDIYDVSMAEVAAANNITDLNSLRIGQVLLVPDPKRFALPVVAAPAPASAPSTSSGSASGSGSTSSSGGTTTQPSAGAVSRSGFIWPVTGPISSYFGPSHPLGIDIDLYANRNAPVMAAASGTVVFAGGNACCSYGYYVVIDHGNGYETLYAHFSRVAVSVGQRVSQGTVIGYGGRTGYSTGEHLHFEVRYNGAIINPLTVLP
jgi:murein DD-endopeptidase MepM/ murein hydrolase activator NlpD